MSVVDNLAKLQYPEHLKCTYPWGATVNCPLWRKMGNKCNAKLGSCEYQCDELRERTKMVNIVVRGHSLDNHRITIEIKLMDKAHHYMNMWNALIGSAEVKLGGLSTHDLGELSHRLYEINQQRATEEDKLACAVMKAEDIKQEAQKGREKYERL